MKTIEEYIEHFSIPNNTKNLLHRFLDHIEVDDFSMTRFFCNYISRDFILKSRAAGNPEAESMSVLGVAEEHEELISEFVLKILNLDMKGIEETLLGSLDSNTNSPEFFLKSRIEKYGFFLHEEDRILAVREALEKLYEKEKEL